MSAPFPKSFARVVANRVVAAQVATTAKVATPSTKMSRKAQQRLRRFVTKATKPKAATAEVVATAEVATAEVVAAPDYQILLALFRKSRKVGSFEIKCQSYARVNKARLNYLNMVRSGFRMDNARRAPVDRMIELVERHPDLTTLLRKMFDYQITIGSNTLFKQCAEGKICDLVCKINALKEAHHKLKTTYDVNDTSLERFGDLIEELITCEIDRAELVARLEVLDAELTPIDDERTRLNKCLKDLDAKIERIEYECKVIKAVESFDAEINTNKAACELIECHIRFRFPSRAAQSMQKP
jgi:hypothetical protein